MTLLEDVQIFNGLVDFAVLQIAQSVPIVSLQQHAHEGVQEVNILGCGVERKRVDGHVRLTETDFKVLASQQRGELSVAMPKVQDDGDGVVLLCVRDEKVQQKALATPGRPQHQRMTDILDVQVERVRGMVRRLEDRQRILPQVRADPLARVEGECETEIGKVRFEQCEPPHVVRAVPRHDTQPRVQQVVGFIEKPTVVNGHGFHGLGGLLLQRALVRAVQHDCQRTGSEKVAVHLKFGQRVPELADRCVCGIVNQHFFGPGIR